MRNCSSYQNVDSLSLLSHGIGCRDLEISSFECPSSEKEEKRRNKKRRVLFSSPLPPQLTSPPAPLLLLLMARGRGRAEIVAEECLGAGPVSCAKNIFHVDAACVRVGNGNGTRRTWRRGNAGALQGPGNETCKASGRETGKRRAELREDEVMLNSEIQTMA